MTKPPKKKNKNKKTSALAAAASQRLARIAGGAASKQQPMNAEQIAHMLLHAEERGEVERVTLDDGSWAWAMPGPDGKPQVLKPTADMLAALERFEREGHPGHE